MADKGMKYSLIFYNVSILYYLEVIGRTGVIYFACVLGVHAKFIAFGSWPAFWHPCSHHILSVNACETQSRTDEFGSCIGVECRVAEGRKYRDK